MSRIIKKIIKCLLSNVNICLLIGVILLVLLVLTKNIYGIIIMLVFDFALLLLKINIDVISQLNNSKKIFTATSKIRNVDCLVIGDMVDTSDLYLKGKEAVELCAPNRNLNESYELLRHTYSILKKNGKVIIACQDKNLYKKEYSVFDIPYFHPVTIKRLELDDNRIKRILPILFAPLQTFRLFLNRRMKYEKTVCKNELICEFCESRGLDLEYRKCI